MVRFASRAHAQADLIVSVLTGDRERIWAWRLLGLWPAENWPDAGAVSHTVAVAVGERPSTLVALVIAAARAGQLGRFIEYVGPAALAEFTRRAWLAAGGATHPRPGMRAGRQAASPHDAADATLIDQLVTLLHQRSEIIACAVRLPAGGRAAPARSPGSGTAAISRSRAGPDPLAESLAALAVLEAEPAMAAHPQAWAAVSAAARALRSARAGQLSAQSAPPDAVRHPDPPGEATAGPAGAAIRPRSLRREPPASGPDAEPNDAKARMRPRIDRDAGPIAPSAGAATAWGGLLFLLPIGAELGTPAAVTAEPDQYGAGLRPVLHELGRQLLARAAPDAEPVDAHDPALLAFCGISPGSKALRPPGPRACERIGLAADSVVAALRERLPGPASYRGDSVMLLSVCRRHAVIKADPGWIDVDLRLDEVRVDVRRAGLDLDPGYLPWLGCVVRFRYV